MNSYERMVGNVNKLYYKETTTISPGSVVYDNVWDLRWHNSLAIQRVYQVSKLLGKCPDVLGRRPGQSAIWYNPPSKVGNGHYHKFEIQDQAYQHTKPARHADFFFVWLRMKMKPEKAANINKITTSAFYYEPGQLACAACHFIEASIATFSVLKDYNNDKVNVEEARREYDNRISEMLPEFLKSEQVEDIRAFPTPLRDIYEEYIMSDRPPEEVFEGYPRDCGCVTVIVTRVTKAGVTGVTEVTEATEAEKAVEVTEADVTEVTKPEKIVGVAEVDVTEVTKPEKVVGVAEVDVMEVTEPEKVTSVPPASGPTESEIVRELTMKRLESELVKSAEKPSLPIEQPSLPTEQPPGLSFEQPPGLSFEQPPGLSFERPSGLSFERSTLPTERSTLPSERPSGLPRETVAPITNGLVPLPLIPTTVTPTGVIKESLTLTDQPKIPLTSLGSTSSGDVSLTGGLNFNSNFDSLKPINTNGASVGRTMKILPNV